MSTPKISSRLAPVTDRVGASIQAEPRRTDRRPVSNQEELKPQEDIAMSGIVHCAVSITMRTPGHDLEWMRGWE
jgi:hypothetical protein